MSSTSCTFSARLNVSSLRRASSSALVSTLYEIVASLSLVKVFKSWVYSLGKKLTGSQTNELYLMDDLPRSDVVILPVHPPDEPLDGVPTVVQDEDDRGEFVGDHRGQLLDSELSERSPQQVVRPIHELMYSQTSVPNEKDGPSQLTIPRGTCGTQKSTDGVTDTTPQDLGNKRGTFGHGHVDHTETRGSGLGEDNIIRPEKLSNTRPQPRLRNDVVGLVGNRVDEWRNGDLLRNAPEFSQFGSQFWKEFLEADSGEEGVQDSGMIRVKLMRGDRSVISYV